MALSVPLSRPTLRVGGGSAFFVRQHYVYGSGHIHEASRGAAPSGRKCERDCSIRCRAIDAYWHSFRILADTLDFSWRIITFGISS